MIRWPRLPGSHPLRLPGVLFVVALAAFLAGLIRGEGDLARLGALGMALAAVAALATLLRRDAP